MCVNFCAERIDRLRARCPQHIGMLREQVQRPGNGVGGGVLARQQQGHHIAVQLFIRQTLRLIGRQQGMQQVGRLVAQLRLSCHLGAGMRNELLHSLARSAQRAFNLAVAAGAVPAPTGPQGIDAMCDAREDAIEVALKRVRVIACQRRHVGPEGQ